MRVLLVDSGASYSTKDVADGIREGLLVNGVEVKNYSLENRLYLCAEWVKKLWKSKGSIPEEKPTWADSAYLASVGALEMALRFEVDWVFAVAGRYLHPDAVVLMKRAGLKVCLALTESPYEDQGQSLITSLVDVAWTNERTSLENLRKVNLRVYYSAHAYRPSIHSPSAVNPFDSEVPEHDVVFVGTDFYERIDLLSQIDWTGIDLGLYGLWTLLPSRHKLRKYLVREITDNVKTAALYRKAKIGLNLHRTSRDYSRQSHKIEYAESLNPRAFELAACGVFYISDWRKEGEEIFGRSVPTFKTPKELELLIRQYLEDSNERQSKAKEALWQVQRFTYGMKVNEMLGALDGN